MYNDQNTVIFNPIKSKMSIPSLGMIAMRSLSFFYHVALPYLKHSF